MKKECPSCAMMVDKNLDRCSVCQYEFTTKKQSKVQWFALVLVIIFLLSLLL